jgi:hypothetical protein
MYIIEKQGIMYITVREEKQLLIIFAQYVVDAIKA